MISIILINHNYGKYIQNCLDSILKNNQTLIGEIIIIDDSSSDNSIQIIKKYLKIPKVKYFYVNFRSLSKSYNYGIRKSKFSFITKVDADDLLEDFFIKDYYDKLLKDNYDLIYGSLKIIDEEMNFIQLKNQSKELIGSKFFYPVGSGTIFKKQIWKQIGGFDEKLKFQDDYDFWLRINKIKNIKIGMIKKTGYKYRMHNNNMSKNLITKNLSKIYVFVKNII
jgi:glycosyltransferase involved in cell wall biosynthesis